MYAVLTQGVLTLDRTNCVSAVLETIAAYFILGERLNRPIEYLGLVAIIAGIFMLHAPAGAIPYN